MTWDMAVRFLAGPPAADVERLEGLWWWGYVGAPPHAQGTRNHAVAWFKPTEFWAEDFKRERR